LVEEGPRVTPRPHEGGNGVLFFGNEEATQRKKVSTKTCCRMPDWNASTGRTELNGKSLSAVACA